MRRPLRASRYLVLAAIAGTLAGGIAASRMGGGGGGSLPLPTTLNDFVMPGTQPNGLLTDIVDSGNCEVCHGGYAEAEEPMTRWAASMMGQAGRDPIFYAALAVANQDATDAGEMCLRCHAPGAWLAGRSTPSDGSAMDPLLGDLDGVTCNLCHRMVDRFYDPGVDPVEDERVLRALNESSGLPSDPHTGQYIIDPIDRRRGPFELSPDFPWHEWVGSAHHTDSAMCGTCHDVSNPVYTYNEGTGTYDFNATDTPHPEPTRTAMFPIERTYSEWANSVYAIDAIETNGRFGGNATAVASCQDCHMPDTSGTGCNPALSPPTRDNLPQHNFNGVNNWVLKAVRSLYSDLETKLTAQSVADAIARTEAFQQASNDMYAFEQGGDLVVRVVNQTGHKLPTGYAEGRRMWLNVIFRDTDNNVLDHRGFYDNATASLNTGDTTVWENKQGLDAGAAALTGLPATESFHFVLNNKIYKDNRIPPRGYTSQAFDAIGASVIGETYQEQQHWHDSTFPIPPGTTTVEVNLWHQTTTKEYIEFLRDENQAPGYNDGQLAYDQWVLHGMSPPVLKNTQTLDIATGACPDPIPYGLGKLGSNSKRLELAWTGTPSLSAGNFTIEVLNGRANFQGTLFWDTATASVPFQGGTQLISSLSNPVKFHLDGAGNASVAIPIDIAMVGTERYYQAVSRDPNLPQPYGVSSGLFVTFCP